MECLSQTQLRRVEEASLNASAPRQQRLLDGWLLRFCPGKAKRARSVQPVAAGHDSVADKWRRCTRIYASIGLPALVRVTPFSEPAGVDAALAALGLIRLEDVRVMTRAVAAPADEPTPETARPWRFEAVGSAEFARWVGQCRASSATEIAGHAERLAQAPVDIGCVLVFDAADTIVAAGHVAREEEVAGLYDIVTTPAARGRGAATALCEHLLQRAAHAGARIAYLQVEDENHAARRIYNRLGFADSYAYHYRVAP